MAKQFQRRSQNQSGKKQFLVKNGPSEEEKIKRRAIIFGLLTLALIISIFIWGIPLFIRLVGSLTELKSEQEQNLTQDVIPPPVPRLSFLPEATNSAVLTITGFTEPRAEVVIEFNQKQITTQADEEGKFILEKLNLDPGENQVRALAIDAAGNKSEYSKPLKVVYDQEPPKLEILSPQDGIAVEERNLEVRGVTEPEARVLVNDHLVIVDEEGKFNTRLILKEGGNQIKIVAQDLAGNQTEKTLTVTYLP